MQTLTLDSALILRNAHRIARSIRAEFASYRAALRTALRRAWTAAKTLACRAAEQPANEQPNAEQPAEQPAQPRVYTLEWDGENPRRYGRPWMARVTSWPVGGRPELEFGAFAGSVADGGTTEIEAVPGDIIRWGQRDNRGGRQTTNEWGIADEDGNMTYCTPAEARAHYRR